MVKKFECSNYEKYEQLISKKNIIINFLDFKNEKQEFKFIIDLNKKIDEFGYKKGMLKFFDKFPSFKTEFNDAKTLQSGDGIFHCYEENLENCLEIGSGLGNIIEILSHNFTNVFSLDKSIENLQFQKNKFQYFQRNNITYLRSEYDKLPFPDNYFDFIICNDLIKKKLSENNVNSQQMVIWIKEIKRVLKNNGTLYFSIDNKIKFKFLDLKNYNILNNKKWVLKYKECCKILKNNGFKFQTYWAFPSFESQLYSGTFNDKKVILWLFKNLDKFLGKNKKISLGKKIFLIFLKYCNVRILKSLILKYTPAYQFCCIKNGTFENTMESKMLEKINSKGFLTLSRRLKIIYFIFDKKRPVKVVKIKKLSYETSNLEINELRENNKINDKEPRLSFENWFSGRMLNPNNQNEIIKALEWIFKFQIKTKKSKLDNEEIENEVNKIKVDLDKYIPKNSLYKQWINNYEAYLKNNLIFKTSEHGDPSFHNFIIDTSKNKINLIDWENFKKEGNPMNDFMLFIFRSILFQRNHSLKTVKRKLVGEDKKFNRILKIFQDKFFEHYGFKMNFIILTRFHILKTLLNKAKYGVNYEKELKIMKLLEISSTYNYKDDSRET